MYMINIVFKIKTICYRDTDSRYTIAKCKIKDYDCDCLEEEIIIKGYFPNLFVGDIFEGVANKLEDNTRGYFLKLLDIPKILIPENKDALATFVSKRVKGLSKNKTFEIIDTLGMDFLYLIKEDYKPLLKVNKITEKKAISIRNQLIIHEGFEQLALFVQSLSLPVKYAVKIYELYGNDGLDIVKTNPYSICYDYTISFQIADTIAVFLKYEMNNPKRINSAILSFINNKSENNGDLCISKKTIISELNSYLDVHGEYKNKNNIKEDEILKGIDFLVETKSIIIEEDLKGYIYIYKPFNNYTENMIISNLKKIINTEIPPFCSKKQIDKFLKNHEDKFFKLDNKQKDAVYVSLMNNISILTGGPGTGKTATTNIIVNCIKSIKNSSKIILLAPTGRASQRMTELTSMEASTIHKCLKINPNIPNIEIVEINADFILVDESSMIDAYLFNNLISAVQKGTRIIFIGDVDQLPSVGAGLIFKDLIDSNKVALTKLTTIFRQAKASLIIKNAHKINVGLKTTDKDGVDISNKLDTNFKLWAENRPNKIKENIILSIDKLVLKYGYKSDQIAVLSPMKKGDLGTFELNRIIQSRYNPQSPFKSEYEINAINCFREGDRVIQNVNNYELNVFNGDIGTINKLYVEIENGVEVYKMEVDYPKKIVTYSELDFEQLELAYAITIHKSQGSEFPAIIIPIHSLQKNMLYRNLIYTGVSRAKDMCIIIGEETALNTAIEQTGGTIRKSLIKEKLSKIKLDMAC